MALKWEGEKVKRKVARAAKHGINQTMSACADHAKQNHDWQNQTGTLEGSIRPVVAAREQGDRIVGVWGSVDVEYALIQELGGTIVPKNFPRLYLQRNGKIFATAESVTIPARPYLRPAADVHYPRLAKRMRMEFKRGEVISR